MDRACHKIAPYRHRIKKIKGVDFNFLRNDTNIICIETVKMINFVRKIQ